LGIRNRFSLDLTLVYKLLECIPDEGISAAQIRKQFPELGGEKVRGLREWADDLGLTCQSEQKTFTSQFGKAASLAKNSSIESKIQEIMYYKLATSYDLEVFSALINDFLFDISRTFDQSFDLEEARRRILALVETGANPKYVRGEVSTAIRALTSEQGVSKLDIVVPISRDCYRVNSYRPDWRTAAYILYDSWPENTSRIRIDEVISGQNSLGRIFFLTEPQVMVLLSKLEQERAIALEIVADLNQIGPNPSMKAEDFLEMLIHDQS
jgi:hypothetical protein